MNSRVMEQPFSTRLSNSFDTSSVGHPRLAVQLQMVTNSPLASVGQSTFSFAQTLLRAFSIPVA